MEPTSTIRRALPAGFAAGAGVGCFVAIVGPSGAGKDTIIRAAQDRLEGDRRFVFARRIITRQGDCTEDHDSVTVPEFEEMRLAGAFLLHWNANGLSYGIPGGLAGDLRLGRVVIGNISRAIVPEIREKFQRLLVVHVTASPDALAARLKARGREDAAAQQARLARALMQDVGLMSDVTIDNSGSLAEAIEQFEDILRSVAFVAPGRT